MSDIYPNVSREVFAARDFALAWRFRSENEGVRVVTGGRLTRQQEQQAKQQLMLLAQAGRFADARTLALQLLQVIPEDLELWNALGQIQVQLGAPFEAMQSFARVGSQRSKLQVSALSWLVDLCLQYGKESEGLPYARKLAALEPRSADSQNKAGRMLNAQYHYLEAKQYFEKASKLEPRNESHQGWYAVNQIFLGECEAAIDNLTKLRSKHKRSSKVTHGQTGPDIELYKIQAWNYVDGADESQILAAHQEYCRAFERPKDALAFAKPKTETAVNPSPQGQRIRVGIISSDIRRHSVAYFLEPILAGHNPDKWELFLYSDTEHYDEVSESLKRHVRHFKHTRELEDAELAQLISQDGIDILIDLVAYLGKVRLGVFAQRPAPVQVTYLAYPNTTGLPEMDYRLTDAWCDPVGLTESYHSEQLVRLPGGFLSFSPDSDAPELTELPASQNGYITFGSFNIYQKISDRNIRLWSELMRQVPGSRLLIKSRPLTEPMLQAHLLQAFAAHGIEADRLTVLGWTKDAASHLDLVSSVDIHLDTFPYNGTTTTCQALWQGVPTLSLAGQSHRSRVGLSLMTQVGLSDWVTEDESEFVEMAVNRANDLTALTAIRAGLRDRMNACALGDAQRFVRSLETAFEGMLEAVNGTQE